MLKTISHDSVIQMLHLGDFDGAVEALGPLWLGAGVFPWRDSRNDHAYASLLMICGVLTTEFGLMGSRLQEKGKDMLTRSIGLFGDDLDGAQQARGWLATAYDRCGDFNEALALSDTILQSKDSKLEVMICARKTKSIALDGLGFPELAYEALSAAVPAINGVSLLTQGKFYLQCGKVLRKLGRLDEALENYDLAMDCFHSAKSPRYEAAASNNIAGVYIDQGEFTRAHVLTQKAIRLFESIGDRNHEGIVWDQSAQIYRKEGKYREAERAALKAISLLERGDHLDFLAEAYTTYGTILVEIGIGAIEPLQKAAEIYARQNNSVYLETVNALTRDAVLRIKRLAKDTSLALHKAVLPAEKLVIEQTLEKHNGQISPTAKELQMTREGLQKRLKQRFPELIEKCQPVRRRKRSIIKTR